MSFQRKPARINYWLLVCSCYLLPLHSHSTPLPETTNEGGKSVVHCAHESIAELIKTSPVILKALGARIFTDSDPLQEDLWWRDSFLAAVDEDASEAGEWKAPARTRDVPSVSGANEVLITLTPGTIYKGASLLKMTAAAKSATIRNSESAGFQYEGQLNATLQPLSCFDANVLKILPTELIAFGKLVTLQQQQEQQEQQHQQHQQQREQQQQNSQLNSDQQQQQQHGADILRVSINGLHRWNPQFENHIWKHLGWDDWSDFTVCSVACGKGVQQRFRRCLLDNPMINLNLNMRANSAEDGMNRKIVTNNDKDGENYDGDDDEDASDDVEKEMVFAENRIHSYRRQNRRRRRSSGSHIIGSNSKDIINDGSWDEQLRSETTTAAESEERRGENNTQHDSSSGTLLSATTTVTAAADINSNHQLRRHLPTQSTRYEYFSDSKTYNLDEISDEYADDDDGDDDDGIMRVFEGNFNSDELTTETAAATAAPRKSDDNDTRTQSESDDQAFDYRGNSKRPPHKTKAKKRRKSAKSISTLFCEGYNIEQRNCNTFECSDDIVELLKFYKKFVLPEDVATSSATTTAANDVQTASVTSTAESSPSLLSSSSSSAAVASATTAASNAGAVSGFVPSPTSSNMGYIKGWHNSINFTIMITLRVKNDTKPTARIFSIRNSTHNLYLEPSIEGLRLYLERDNATEMLPVKFNLYDYRWHQVAISIQNGDFISIFVDCSWTNSFVVSKHLFSLPLNADVEIGRGFNGELQQLLVLPDNQERHQCSNVRTSINEVKRYIIDTFIDDYSN